MVRKYWLFFIPYLAFDVLFFALQGPVFIISAIFVYFYIKFRVINTINKKIRVLICLSSMILFVFFQYTP
jgi:hypothetical protein